MKSLSLIYVVIGVLNFSVAQALDNYPSNPEKLDHIWFKAPVYKSTTKDGVMQFRLNPEFGKGYQEMVDLDKGITRFTLDRKDSVQNTLETFESVVKGKSQTITEFYSNTDRFNESPDHHKADVWQIQDGNLSSYTRCMKTYNRINVEDKSPIEYCYTISPSSCEQLGKNLTEVLKSAKMNEGDLAKCQQFVGNNAKFLALIKPDGKSMETLNGFNGTNKKHIKFPAQKSYNPISSLEMLMDAKAECSDYASLWNKQKRTTKSASPVGSAKVNN